MVKELLKGGAALHRKGDSERLDLVMVNPTTERCSTVPPRRRRYKTPRVASCGNPQQLNFFISTHGVRNWLF
jgi:hypothetical protein